MAGFHKLGVALGRRDVWFGLLYLAGLATTLGFYMQSTLQAKVAATEAAIIFTTEPVFATLLAVSGIVPGVKETLTITQASGAVLIVVAMLMAELGPRLVRQCGVTAQG